MVDKIIDKINDQNQQYHGRQDHQYKEVRLEQLEDKIMILRPSSVSKLL